MDYLNKELFYIRPDLASPLLSTNNKFHSRDVVHTTINGMEPENRLKGKSVVKLFLVRADTITAYIPVSYTHLTLPTICSV